MQRREFLKSLSALLLYKALPFQARMTISSPVAPKGTVCDIHIHLLGTSQENGCFVSDEYARSIPYRMSSLFVDMDRDGQALEKDRSYVESLATLLDESLEHRYGILLAMDGIYDDLGKLDRKHTPFFVSNDYLFSICERHEKFVPGASINPFRTDALDELNAVAARGAAVIKWIPNSQNIDPSDPRILPFYRRLNELDLPLLTHCGREHAVSSMNQSYGDPALLRPALEEGVRIIVAHCAAGGRDERGSYFHRFLDMLESYPNLYGDISALTMIHKNLRLRYLLDHPDLFDRLYYGSDFPLQFFPATSPFYFMGRLSFAEAWQIQEIDNVLRRDVATLRALGVPESCLNRGMDLVKKKT